MRRRFIDELKLVRDDNIKLFNFCNIMALECHEEGRIEEQKYWTEKAAWAAEQNRRIVIEIQKAEKEES